MSYPEVRITDIVGKVWIPAAMVKPTEQAHKAKGFSEVQKPTFAEYLLREQNKIKNIKE